MLYPFWGKNLEEPNHPASGRYDRYKDTGSEFLQMTALEDADIAVFPGAWEQVYDDSPSLSLAEKFLEKARKAGKTAVIFFWSDSDESVYYEDTIVLRTSLYRSRRDPDEFAMPSWSEDTVERYLNGEPQIRPKLAKPVIGFCGYAAPIHQSIRRRLRNALIKAANALGPGGIVGDPPGSTLRAEALRVLSRSPQVETNFTVRDRFQGGALQSDGSVDLSVLQKVRHEFVQNMVESDYILCVRGGGNYSYRLYETLSCGRIPVFIDTDCVLPYDFFLDWKKYCVWVDETELPRIADIVADFHDDLSPQDFVNLQLRCRKLWEKWLSPQGFFANFHRHLPHQRFQGS